MTPAKESVLERVLREVPDSPHPSPVPIEKTPFFKGNWFHAGRRAVEILEDPNEIRDFMGQYITHIQEEYGISNREEAEKNAKDVVGYCTGYVDDRKANTWFNALPNISHPIMGRERPFMKRDVESYYFIVHSSDSEVRDYLRTNLQKNLLLFDASLVKGKDNKSYFAFVLTPKKERISVPPTQEYMLLRGYIDGLVYKMKEEIGKSCKSTLETVSKDK